MIFGLPKKRLVSVIIGVILGLGVITAGPFIAWVVMFNTAFLIPDGRWDKYDSMSVKVSREIGRAHV